MKIPKVNTNFYFPIFILKTCLENCSSFLKINTSIIFFMWKLPKKNTFIIWTKNINKKKKLRSKPKLFIVIRYINKEIIRTYFFNEKHNWKSIYIITLLYLQKDFNSWNLDTQNSNNNNNNNNIIISPTFF